MAAVQPHTGSVPGAAHGARPTRRWLPPAHSPLSGAALGRAVVSELAWGGDPRERLARWLASRFSADRVLLVDSGTHALQMALDMARVHAGGALTVALPAYSCFDVATAAVGAGARVSLYDLDPNSLAPDPASLRRAMAQGARVAVIAPLFGIPVDWESVERVAAEFGALVIEDAAQSSGATWLGRPLGSHGRMSVLSFGRGKGWTGGCGGALLMRGAEASGVAPFAERGRGSGAAGTLARAAAQWLFGRPGWYVIPARIPWLHLGETLYRNPTGTRGMPRVAASLLDASRDAAAREAEARRANASAFGVSLAAAAHVRTIRPAAGGVPGYLRYPILLSRGMASFHDPTAAARLGISGGYPSTLRDLPQVRERLAGSPAAEGWPGALELVRSLVALPTHSRVSSEARQEVLACLTESAG